MNEVQIHDFASSLVRIHGERAEARAAQKASNLAAGGDPLQAEEWRRIRVAVTMMRGPGVS